MASEARFDNRFIKSLATHLEEFQQKWMSAKTWVQLIVKYSITDPTLGFYGDQLDRCLNSRENVRLREQMDLKSNVPGDHIGIFCEHIRKNGMSKKIYYYYARPIGETPLKTQNKWFDCISDAEELLKKITRNETMLPLSNSPNLIQEPAKIKRRLRTSEAPAPENVPLSSAIIGVSTSSNGHHCSATATLIDYFDFPEANHLFATKDDETIANQSIHRLLCCCLQMKVLLSICPYLMGERNLIRTR
jgi:hypothetical protein